MFVVEVRGRPIPWYAGKTHSSFRNEIFQKHKVEKYCNALAACNGDTKVILFPRCAGRNEVVQTRPLSASAKEEIDWLENRLILQALNSNPEILNVSMTRRDRNTLVYGLNDQRNDPRRGRPYAAITYSRLALGIQ
ncbi:MAG: hypothetical protein JJU07_14000 [Natronohydrobacter sp.]|nr:hypothetical protein [Natronohydrobacter sp.]